MKTPNDPNDEWKREVWNESPEAIAHAKSRNIAIRKIMHSTVCLCCGNQPGPGARCPECGREADNPHLMPEFAPEASGVKPHCAPTPDAVGSEAMRSKDPLSDAIFALVGELKADREQRKTEHEILRAVLGLQHSLQEIRNLITMKANELTTLLNSISDGVDAANTSLDDVSVELGKVNTEVTALAGTVAGNADLPPEVTDAVTRLQAATSALTSKVTAAKTATQAVDDLIPDAAPPA